MAVSKYHFVKHKNGSMIPSDGVMMKVSEIKDVELGNDLRGAANNITI